MRVTRCHVTQALQADSEVTLPEEAANHLLRVLRLREGDTCVLFNGDGHDYPATLVAASKRDARVRIDVAQPVGNESPLQITLVQGIARGDKMDLILQKATELGVAAVIPVTAERTEVRLDAERAAKRLAHWHSVVVAACEQSGRAQLPTLAPPTALDHLASQLPGGALRLTLDPQGEHSLRTTNVSTTQVVVAIGPEGGWSPRDREVLARGQFQGLRLGPRVLRTETAGLAAIAALQARFGDL